MASSNKVQFNLKNVYYAVVSNAETPAWSTPVAIPGAVSLTLDAEGSITPFYADGQIYYQAVSNQGYSGSLEIAKVPDAMLKDVWGFSLDDTDKTLTEDATVEPAKIALLYQIDGDADEELYALYYCAVTRPGIGSQTIEESKDPVTQSFNITAAPLPNGKVMARTTADTPSATRNTWFSAVYTA